MNKNKRNILKGIAITAWVPPVIDMVILPVHAQTTDAPPPVDPPIDPPVEPPIEPPIECEEGYELIDGECVKIPPEPAYCDDGLVAVCYQVDDTTFRTLCKTPEDAAYYVENFERYTMGPCHGVTPKPF